MSKYNISASTNALSAVLSGLLTMQFDCEMSAIVTDEESFLLDIQKFQNHNNLPSDHHALNFIVDTITKKFAEEEAKGFLVTISARALNYSISVWVDELEQYDIGDLCHEISSKINDHLGTIKKCVLL